MSGKMRPAFETTGSKIAEPESGDPGRPGAAKAAGLIGRRGALALLGSVATGSLALAQDAPIVAPPLPTPLPTPPLATPPGTPPLAMPRPPAAPNIVPSRPIGPIARDKAYYIFFQLNIDVQTAKTLRNHLAVLVEGGVLDITLIVASGGGFVVPALQLYEFIRMLPVTVTTHAQILVASAANILFLAGTDRSAEANAKFLFHPGQTTIAGSFSIPQMADQVGLMNVALDFVETIYRDRTKLPDTEIQKFRAETVIYDAAKAHDYGIVDTIGGLKIPGEGKARFIFVE